MTGQQNPSAMKSDVIIVGGGPVGLVLGMDLASRGVQVILFEERSMEEPLPPRTNHIASRTMELFRRLDIAADIRACGLPSDYPQDVMYRTTLSGPQLARIKIPASDRRWDESAEGNDVWWPTPEPSHRANQMFTDPILVKHALKTPGLRVIDRTRVEDVIENGERVFATATDLESGQSIQAEASFLIGCDGGHSRIRKEIGAVLSGDAHVQHTETLLFECPYILESLDGEAAWQIHFMNSRQAGAIVAIDGEKTWLANIPLKKGEEASDPDTRVRKVRDMLGISEEVPLRAIRMTDSIGRRLVTDRFRKGRIFICGDAAHTWLPFAGFGMNAGLADAANLAWLMAAHINGWAPIGILDAYERERLPVTEQVSHFAMNIALDVIRERSLISPYIEEDSPRGLSTRRKLGKEMNEIGRNQYCPGGLNFGYFYDKSPIIAYDGEEHPAYSMYDFVQSTVPGCRTPHVWLADGSSLYDALGLDYTLIRTDPNVDVSAIIEAARDRGVPLSVFDLDTLDPAYEHRLVLSRPDRHVAWRGDAIPENPLGLIDLIRGVSEAPAEI